MSVNLLKLKLPAEYQEVEYIQSTGTQYIDTGFCPDYKTSFKIKMYINSDNNSHDFFFGVVFDNVPSAPAGAFRLFHHKQNQLYGTQPYRDDVITSINLPLNGEYMFNNGSFYYNNVILSYKSGSRVSNWSINYPMYIFCENNVPEGGAKFGTTTNIDRRFYGGQIFQDGVLVRNFIPCYRKSDNEIGLFDLVNGVFYTNQGTGTFSKGGDLHEFQKVKINITAKDSPRIPDTYQEVEYVQSSGTQYIDTGINLTSDDTVKCKFEITARPTDYNYRDGIYGTMEKQNNINTFFVLLMRDPNVARVGTNVAPVNQVETTNLVLNQIYDTTLSNGTYIENGTTYTFNLHSGFTFSTSCWFFRRNQSSMLATSAKVYSFEIVGKFNAIPCYRKSDGVIGFYDTITNTFFTNAGTGTFTKGAVVDLPSEYQKLQYIQTTGTQYIDTLLYPHQIGKWELDIQYTDSNPSNQTNGCFPVANQRFDIGTTSASKWTLNMGALNTYTDTDNNRHLFVLDKINNKVLIDSTEYSVTATTFTSQTTYSVLIGARNYYGSSSKYNCSEKIYSSKIYDTSGVLIRDYVPCYNKSSGIIGLYDLVNSAFYQNAGTGTFLKSGDVLPIKKVKAYILNIILPSEYQRVEYLGVSSNNPYIDTGVTGDQKTKAEVTFSSSGDTQVCLFGYQANAVGITFNLSQTSNNTRFGAWAKVGWGSDMFDGNKHTVEISQSGLYQDGTLADTPTAQTFTTGNFTLFKADGAVTYGNKTIYGCRIWNDGVLQRDFIPCYRKSDNVIGMYDLVEGNFYTNVGTGSFTKGSNLNNCDIIKI